MMYNIFFYHFMYLCLCNSNNIMNLKRESDFLERTILNIVRQYRHRAAGQAAWDHTASRRC